jgi:glutamate synthase (NADPH/NADH) large chain
MPDDEWTAMFSSAAQPHPQGLYDGLDEHDACGVAFVATLTGHASHDIVDKALTALRNLEHRGASGAEPDSGDGAGILIQVPDAYLRDVVPFPLPTAGHYAVGVGFLPPDPDEASAVRDAIGAIAAQEGVEVLGWREVPTDPSLVGVTARSVMPSFWQLFAGASGGDESGLALDRRVYPLRKRVEHELGVYFASLSSRTLVYKGMLTTGQLEPFYPELSDPRLASALALVHSRFSPTRSSRRWRTCTATCRTTARSTPCAATATGCRHVRR